MLIILNLRKRSDLKEFVEKPQLDFVDASQPKNI